MREKRTFIGTAAAQMHWWVKSMHCAWNGYSLVVCCKLYRNLASLLSSLTAIIFIIVIVIIVIVTLLSLLLLLLLLRVRIENCFFCVTKVPLNIQFFLCLIDDFF